VSAELAPTDRKNEHLNMRIDQKFAFAVWFATTVTGQQKQTFVERAVLKALKEVRDPNGRPWTDYWDVSEGVRRLNVLRFAGFDTSAEDDELLAFVDQHRIFFYNDAEAKQPARTRIDLLWPNISTYVEAWRRNRASDPNVANRMMRETLEKAGWIPADEDIPY
jgi:hypothetical protein